MPPPLSALSAADIRALVRGPTADERAAVAERLCEKIKSGIGETERGAAEEVLRLMAADAAELVRRALSVSFKQSTALPRDVALQLAKDVDSVAGPLLTFSPVFTDDDLAEVVAVSSALKQLAVARREVLAESVTAALAAYAAEEAVQTAIANDNAAFSEPSLSRVVERFAESEGVTTAVAYRRVLPLSICERLVALVADHVRQHLLEHHQLSPATAIALVVDAQERATIDLVEEASRAADLPAFIAHLHKRDRLTGSLVLRALARGQITFVERAVAELSGVPHHRAWLMIHDAGALGLQAIYDRSGLPPRLFAAFRAGVDAYHALQVEGGAVSPETFQDRMLQRFLTQPHRGGREDAAYLLEKIGCRAAPSTPQRSPAQRQAQAQAQAKVHLQTKSEARRAAPVGVRPRLSA